MNKKIKDLVKDTIIFAIGSLGSKVILFLLVPLYTNCLSQEEYGIAELVFTVSQLLAPIASLVIWNSVIRYGLMHGKRPEDVLASSVWVWLFAVALILVLTPLYRFYAPVSAWRWYLSGYSIAYITTMIEMSYLKVKGKNKLYSLISLLQALTLAGLNIVLLVFLDLGVEGYLLSNIAANLLVVVLAFLCGGLYRDVSRAKPSRELLIQMVLFSAPLILNDVSWWFIHSSDKIMVEFMVGAAALGVYTVASKIPSLINTFVTIFSQAWGVSSIKEIESTNDYSFYTQVFRTYSAIAFGAAICLIAIIKPFMQVYVGSGFTEAWRYVPLLLVAAAFSAISSYFGSMYGALKMSVACMWTTVIGGLTNLVLNYVFIRMIGAWGAIIGTVSAFGIIAFLRLLGVTRAIPIQVPWRHFLIDIGTALVQALLVSMDWYPYPVSAAAVLILVCNHLSDLRTLWKLLPRKTR